MGPSSAVAALSFSVIVGLGVAIGSPEFIVLTIALHKFTPKLPAALIVLFLAIIASTLLGFEALGIHVVGEIPAGLPDFGFPEELGFDKLLAVPSGAIGVALGLLEGLVIANAHDFVTAVRQAIAAADPQPHVPLIDGESMNDIDATAVIALSEFQEQLEQTGIELRFARVKTHVMDIIERGGLEDAIPPEHFYPSVQTAVDAFLAAEQEP